MITSKKQPTKHKISKVTAMIDEETGEKIPVVQVSQEIDDRDFNFHKIWFGHFIQSLDTITSQRLKLAFWIIDHLDSNNKLSMTQRQIAEQSGISLKTVGLTMRALQEGDLPFLRRLNGGTYIVNPDIIFKGNFGKRMAVLYDYGRANTSPDSRKKDNVVTDINTANKENKKRNKRNRRNRKNKRATA